MAEKNIIGIDLGTTMSAIAKLNKLGTPEIVPNSDGERIMPSVINFSHNSLLIGQEAKNSAVDEPDRVVKEFKREMHNPEYKFSVDSKSFSATELSSMVLKKLVQDASQKIGEIKDVVITVPAYFKETQRNATMEAGRLAGLNVLAIINEPTSAALFYAKESNINGKGLVYDLGGGTFDITMVQTNANQVTILGSEGDAQLGGIDFDRVIFELLEEKYKAQTNYDLCADEESKEEFKLLAEDIKKSLSKKDSIKKRIRGSFGNATIEITQAEFEQKASSLISRTEMLVGQLLDDTNTRANQVDYILLVGGSTRLPFVRKSILKLFNKEPLNAVNVDEVVALGAAIKAGMVMVNTMPTVIESSIKSNLQNLKVQDVANHSYGTIAIDSQRGVEVNEIIIPKNTPLPCQKSKTFFIMHDGQKVVDEQITQGEDDDPEFVDIIDSFELHINGQTIAGDELVSTYSYDENQIMTCKVEHLKTRSVAYSDINMKQQAQKPINPLDEFLMD